MLMPHRILVLGTGPEARLVEASLTGANRAGLCVVGFYPLENDADSVVPQNRLIPTAESLDDAVRQLGVDEIIVAVRQQRGGVLPLRSLLDCRLRGVQVTDLAGFFERVHDQVPIESLKVSWLIYGPGFRQNLFRTLVKRSFDLVVSAVLIVLSLPVAIVTAVLIAAEGGGPIIYRQERVGHRGEPFTVLKFRSMAHDAEKDGRAAWARANDERVTRVGRFIRRTRIDELPQLLNVLKGEMSFVGPRPERPQFVDQLNREIRYYSVRHSVKPGLTGWAQLRYPYGASVQDAEEKLKFDLFYVKNHGLLLDLMILLQTVEVVMFRRGAR
jgi:sugar transferase (PEP-CTERM system associated)